MTRSPSAGAEPSTDSRRHRRMILSGLAGGGLSLALAPYARSEQLDVPPFESGRYQFTVLRPRRDVPAVRLFRLDGATVELSALKGRPILLPPELCNISFWTIWFRTINFGFRGAIA